MRNRSSLLIGTELIVIGIHTARLNWYRGSQWITRASRSGRGMNGRMDGRTGPTCAQCTAMLNEECRRPGRHQYRANLLNYGSACVFQEDRWNLMEPNGYSFKVKVCLSLARGEPTRFFFLPIFFSTRPTIRGY